MAAREPLRRLVSATLALAILTAAPAADAWAKGSAFEPPPAPGTPFVVRGWAHLVDGDTLDIRGIRIRLSGVDAPERGQVCRRDGWLVGCGALATEALARVIGPQEVVCRIEGPGGFGRAAARCWAGRTELGGWMVWAGWAVVAERYTRDPLYLRYQAEARAERRGVWAEPRFILPEDWRRGVRR